MNDAPVSPVSRGWEIVRTLFDGVPKMSSVDARGLLAEYVRLMELPKMLEKESDDKRYLHSVILSVAVRMSMAYPDFHFVPFFNLWGLENLRREDLEPYEHEGRMCSSLIERAAKAYAYSLLFHPQEKLAKEQEEVLMPFLNNKRFVFVDGSVCQNMLATSVTTGNVDGRKMTFVHLVTPQGLVLSTEVHKLTAFQPLRYAAIPGMLFRAIVRLSEKGVPRIEAAIPLPEGRIEEHFPLVVGYVENVDENHDHIHVYDQYSRHFVAERSKVRAVKGQYVAFVPVIPQDSKFKTAFITGVYEPEEGAKAYGFRRATVEGVSKSRGYLRWTLVEGEPTIAEAGVKGPYFGGGTLSFQFFENAGIPVPSVGAKIRIIVFLKRGKDGEKHPHVVHVEL